VRATRSGPRTPTRIRSIQRAAGRQPAPNPRQDYGRQSKRGGTR
jgi:hypothetical protein